MIVPFLVGMSTAVFTSLVYTKKYLPGKKEESIPKFLGYNLLICMPLNMVILALIK